MTESSALEGTVFESFPEKREEYSDFVLAVPEDSARRLDFIWVAETGSKTLPQFNSKGEEESFSDVREAASTGDLEDFYWVPIGERVSESYGVTSLDESDFEAFRRVEKTVHRQGLREEERKFYVIGVNESYLAVSPEGKPFTLTDRGFVPAELEDKN